MKIDFLKKRAESFLRNAKDLIRKKEYHLAAFNLEQSAQLYLKYYLYIKLKDFPKIHSLDELLVDLGKTYKKEREIEKLKKNNVHLIADLDQAYITARYLPAEFSKTQVEQMRKFVEDLIKFLRKV